MANDRGYSLRVTRTLTAEQIFALRDRAQGADRRSRDTVCVEIYSVYAKEKETVPDFIRNYVSWGAGPRQPVPGARCKGPRILHGALANCEDVRAVALPVLRHRIMTNFNAEAEGIKPDDIVRRLTEFIPVDEDENKRGRLPEVFRAADAARLQGLSCALKRLSKATWRESTKARITDSRSSSQSTANTCPAMICARLIGRSSEKPTSIT